MRRNKILAGLAVLTMLSAAGCGATDANAGELRGAGRAASAPRLTVPSGVPSASAAPSPSSSPSPKAKAKSGATPKAAAADSSSVTPPDTSERDPFLRPFAATSVWNTAIGSDAKYAKVSIGSSGIGTDVVRIVKVKSSDPTVPSYDAANFAGTRCEGTKAQQQATWHAGLDKVRVPADLEIPDAITVGQYWTPNSKLSLVMPDGKTLRQFMPACKKKNGPLYGYAYPAQNVRGDGLCCGHGGSSLSGMGGVIRKGELTSDEPIRHVLSINLWGEYLHYDQATSNGHVWPAASHDGVAPSTYHGKNGNLRMGTLLAIPPSVNADSLGLKTEAAKKLFRAMRDYGLLVVDDTGQNTQELNVEKGAEDELKEKVTGGKEWRDYQPLANDFTKLMKQVRVVTNNGPNAVGGGGTPRVAKQGALK